MLLVCTRNLVDKDCKRKKMGKKYFVGLSVFLIFSIGLNVFFLMSDGLFYWKQKRLAKICASEEKCLTSKNAFYRQIIPASLKWSTTGWTSQTPTINGTPKENLLFNLKGKEGFKPFSSSEEGWLIHAVLEYAIKEKDKNLIEEIEDIFQKEILYTKIQVTDQAINGVVACQLYKHSKKNIYKDYADKMFKWIKSKDTPYGIVYHGLKEISNVDGIGMCVPFLSQYSKTFKKSEAYRLALKQINVYNKFGVDSETGFPAQGYSLSLPHIKMGSCNWGRGISWYLCGLSYVKYEDLDNCAQKKIKLFNENIVRLYDKWGGMFSQFYAQGGLDLSATLPCLYYLYSQGIVSYSEKQVLSFSKYMHDGILYNSSGPIRGCNYYSEYFGPNPISQAFMIKLLNLNYGRDEK